MTDFVLPETHYALSGDVNIAYQTMGDGPENIIIVPGVVSHVEFLHEIPGYTAFLRRLSTFARVVTFDKRGQGLSDRVSDAPSLEQRMDDVRAIMDEVGLERAVLIGYSEGCAMSTLFAATYPERVSRLVLFGGFARNLALSGDEGEKIISERVKHWGSGGMIKRVRPSDAENPAIREIRAALGQPWSNWSVFAIKCTNRCNIDPSKRACTGPCASSPNRCLDPGPMGAGPGGADSCRQIDRVC